MQARPVKITAIWPEEWSANGLAASKSMLIVRIFIGTRSIRHLSYCTLTKWSNMHENPINFAGIYLVGRMIFHGEVHLQVILPNPLENCL